MQKFSLQRKQSGFRAVLLFGVLVGLLFSCGEGIRLLPFPATEITENNSLRPNDNQEIGYQKNAHRFENWQGKYQSKVQRDSQKHWTGSYITPHHSPVFSFAARLGNDFAFNSRFFKSRLFSALLRSRAPPSS